MTNSACFSNAQDLPETDVLEKEESSLVQSNKSRKPQKSSKGKKREKVGLNSLRNDVKIVLEHIGDQDKKRADKVQKLKSAVKQNTYVINVSEISKKIAHSLKKNR